MRAGHQGFIYHARQTNPTTKPIPCAPLHTKAAALDVCTTFTSRLCQDHQDPHGERRVCGNAQEGVRSDNEAWAIFCCQLQPGDFHNPKRMSEGAKVDASGTSQRDRQIEGRWN